MSLTPQERTIIGRYCEFLNTVNRSHGEPPFYAVDSFDPDVNKYAAVAEHTRYGTPSHYEVVVLEIYDGDDGDSTMLTVWCTDDGTPWHAVSEFDTMVGQWLFEGHIVNERGFSFAS